MTLISFNSECVCVKILSCCSFCNNSCVVIFWQQKPVPPDEVKKNLYLYCLDNILPTLRKLQEEQGEELSIERIKQG